LAGAARGVGNTVMASCAAKALFTGAGSLGNGNGGGWLGATGTLVRRTGGAGSGSMAAARGGVGARTTFIAGTWSLRSSSDGREVRLAPGTSKRIISTLA
jgi:hypothetical protein